MNFREIFERLVKLWAGKFRLSLRILKTHSVKLPEKVRGLEGTWGLLVLEVVWYHNSLLAGVLLILFLDPPSILVAKSYYQDMFSSLQN